MGKTFEMITVCLLVVVLWGINLSGQARAESSADKQLIAHGRYISRIGGCNDCHTPDFLLSEGQVPEKLWLTGSGFGWRGPWGTTYPPNLRLLLGKLTEDQWVALAKSLKARPPMPWFDLNIMNEDDLRGLYHFVRYLGPGGEPAPPYVPPEKEPKGPYALFPSPPK